MHQIKRTIETGTVVIGSPDLYLTIRAAMTLCGTSLNAWCKANGLNRQTVEKALKGERHSRQAATIRGSLVEEFLSSSGVAA